jgi:hypothetical protein
MEEDVVPENGFKDTRDGAPKLRLSQTSNNGVRVIAGNIAEEEDRALRWPFAMQTYSKMLKDATIAPAVSAVEMAIARVPWEVKAQPGKEEEQAKQVAFLQQVMIDMEQPFAEAVRFLGTHNSYGFAVSEKVYRFREYVKGSKFNDGLIGLKKLAPIPQESVVAWNFKDRGKDLDGLWQAPPVVSNRNSFEISTNGEPVFIPRKKFILVKNNGNKNNPEGVSPLKSVYRAWRYKQSLEEFEATSVSNDVRGMKVLYIPPQYLDPEASPEDKAVYEFYKRGISSVNNNEQSAMILPMFRDEHGNKMFEFEAVSVMGTRSNDVDAMITRYRKEIVTGLMASQLILGQEGGGSFSLAESLDSVTKMVVDTRLTQIKEQLNHDLIPQLFALNGWDITNTPYFDYGEVSSESLDEIGKYIQRVAAVGLAPKTPEMVNYITDRLGMSPQFKDDDDREDFLEKLTQYESGAGEGLESGTGNGTGKSVSARDNTSANLEGAA